jgi:hypothetical protein
MPQNTLKVDKNQQQKKCFFGLHLTFYMNIDFGIFFLKKFSGLVRIFGSDFDNGINITAQI